jgi:glycosyltransferase involved in cell wall biosynthesis
LSFSIVIASHGKEIWKDLALTRALPSAENQGAEVLIEHDPNGTRAEVRNRLIEKASGDWIITLDADDQLEPGYVAAMEAAKVDNALLTPRIAYVRRGVRQQPKFWPEFDLQRGNWMVVGTAAPRELMLAVGGWRSFYGSGVLNQWDDWDMWIRCTQAGAQIVKVPDAVYIVNVSNSPHYARTRKQTNSWLEEIRKANDLPWQ